ncbi:AI-2E family transporter [Sphingobacteriaceae bacterium WQ 2009]|uniref:AI-2E family transporter n=1 Tax=Rhinopithecimicrobium faecis TaxID=2820698 RepID=A0A8T4H986_9SPHI|nr:AI-2E family transporter [Sphingobacteriaceae bacterium WQ 2009]
MDRWYSLPFYLKSACVLISILIFGYLAKVGDLILVPLILGALFALLLVPLCRFLERLKLPRTFASFLSTILFFGLIITGFYILASQLTILKEDFPAFQKQLTDVGQQLQNFVSKQFGIEYKQQIQYLSSTAQKSVDAGSMLLGTALLSLSSLFILLVFTFLYTFFLLIYRSHLVRFLMILNHEKYHKNILDIVHQIQYVVKKYLIGLLIQMLLVSILVFIALTAVGVKYGLLLAVITGVFNILPYVGIFSSLLIITIITFATSSLTNVIIVAVAICVIHMIDSNFIVPKIVGSKVKINSMFAMMAIILGEMIWGISGMFLAIPILAIIKIIFDRIADLAPWGFLLGEEASEKDAPDVIIQEPPVEKS